MRGMIDKWNLSAYSSYRGWDAFREDIKNGYDVNTRGGLNNDDATLAIATRYGYTEAVKILIEFNADVNIEGAMGQTPLMYASWKGYADIVQLLLNDNAEVNKLSKYGETALFYAIRNTNDPEVVRLLLEAGAKADIINSQGKSPLDLLSDKYKAYLKSLTAERDELKEKVTIRDNAIDSACKDLCGLWEGNQNCNGCPKKGIACSKDASLRNHYITKAMERLCE
jgi:ankyrin repeat protein